jgi:hypothetical protein
MASKVEGAFFWSPDDDGYSPPLLAIVTQVLVEPVGRAVSLPNIQTRIASGLIVSHSGRPKQQIHTRNVELRASSRISEHIARTFRGPGLGYRNLTFSAFPLHDFSRTPSCDLVCLLPGTSEEYWPEVVPMISRICPAG